MRFFFLKKRGNLTSFRYDAFFQKNMNIRGKPSTWCTQGLNGYSCFLNFLIMFYLWYAWEFDRLCAQNKNVLGGKTWSVPSPYMRVFLLLGCGN